MEHRARYRHAGEADEGPRTLMRLSTFLRAETDALERLARWLGVRFLGLSHEQLACNCEQAV